MWEMTIAYHWCIQHTTAFKNGQWSLQNIVAISWFGLKKQKGEIRGFGFLHSTCFTPSCALVIWMHRVTTLQSIAFKTDKRHAEVRSYYIQYWAKWADNFPNWMHNFDGLSTRNAWQNHLTIGRMETIYVHYTHVAIRVNCLCFRSQFTF